ncbi:MAG: Fe-S cluster assembly scaffold protein NifU [Candidatus Acidiferrum sp.]
MAGFSEAVLDHFQNPRNSGELLAATHRVEVSNPVCGDVLHLDARIEDDVIVEAKFLCRGCTTAIACASWLTEHVSGKTLDETRNLNAGSISAGMGELPQETRHGAILAADALKALLTLLS